MPSLLWLGKEFITSGSGAEPYPTQFITLPTSQAIFRVVFFQVAASPLYRADHFPPAILPRIYPHQIFSPLYLSTSEI